MAAGAGEITELIYFGREELELAIVRGGTETRYRFQREQTPILATIHYSPEFQRDFQDRVEVFQQILEIVRKAFHNEPPRLPVPLLAPEPRRFYIRPPENYAELSEEEQLEWARRVGDEIRARRDNPE